MPDPKPEIIDGVPICSGRCRAFIDSTTCQTGQPCRPAIREMAEENERLKIEIEELKAQRDGKEKCEVCGKYFDLNQGVSDVEGVFFCKSCIAAAKSEGGQG